MKDYRNIERIETLDDGSMNIFLRNGRRALIQIQRLGVAFQAEVYQLLSGIPGEGEGDLLKRLKQHEAYQECAREAIGWVDDNAERVERPADTGQRIPVK